MKRPDHSTADAAADPEHPVLGSKFQAGSRCELFGLRQRHLESVCGPVSISGMAALTHSRMLVAPVCSRIGHDSVLRHEICRGLERVALECRVKGAAMLIAEQSAVADYAVRAAELFRVPLVNLQTLSKRSTSVSAAAVVVRSTGDTAASRDMAAICLADRVEALYVRRGGHLAACLGHRLSKQQDGSTRVAVAGRTECAAAELIAAGAVGRLIGERITQSDEANPSDRELPSQRGNTRSATHPSEIDLPDWMMDSERWLTHCTRGRRAEWPGQTKRQYLDALLLNRHASCDEFSASTALRRILRTRRLVGSSATTRGRVPVVCFSALPLASLLARRCYRPHLHRWDYEPYGLAIAKRFADKLGLQPVIYGDREEFRRLPAASRFRFQARGRTYDWTEEREWRAAGDVAFGSLPASAVHVFVPSARERCWLQPQSPWPVSVVPSSLLRSARPATRDRNADRP